jgi:hypothetical protein
MSSIMDEWGDALVEETLREAAGTFFGARKEVEDEISLFASRVADLRAQAEKKIRPWSAGLFFLLGPAGGQKLLDALGVILPAEYISGGDRPLLPRLRSFTRKGLFIKTGRQMYMSLAEEISAYLHGTLYPDPLYPGHKLKTVHYLQLKRHCESINAHIAHVNKSNRPSASLAFAKRMDQDLVRKETVTGGGVGMASLDEELAFAPLVFDQYDLPFFSDFPVDAATEKLVKDCCAEVYSEDPRRADRTLEELTQS